MRLGVLVVFIVAVSSSCSSLPTRGPGGGRCVDSSDCGSGMTCDPGTLWCVCAGPNCPTDGAAGAGGGEGTGPGSGGTGGATGGGTGGSAGHAGARRIGRGRGRSAPPTEAGRT